MTSIMELDKEYLIVCCDMFWWWGRNVVLYKYVILMFGNEIYMLAYFRGQILACVHILGKAQG